MIPPVTQPSGHDRSFGRLTPMLAGALHTGTARTLIRTTTIFVAATAIGRASRLLVWALLPQLQTAVKAPDDLAK